MPSIKKRIQVRVTPEVEEALEAFKAISGVAPASFAAQLLNDSLPMILSLTASLEAVKVADDLGTDFGLEAVRQALIISKSIRNSSKDVVPEIEQINTYDMLRKVRSDS